MQMFFYITCANTKEAKKISSVLVKKKLIACANIFNNIQSVFSWKNKVNFSKEVIIMGKTTNKRRTKIISEVKKYTLMMCLVLYFLKFHQEIKIF